MSFTQSPLELPVRGINVLSPEYLIAADQAYWMKNCRVINDRLETVRPSRNFSYTINEEWLGNPLKYSTEFIYVVRPRNESPRYVFARSDQFGILSGPLDLAPTIRTLPEASSDDYQIVGTQCNDILMLAGFDNDNYVYDTDTNTFRTVGLTPPVVANVHVAGEGTTEHRTFYVTYYNQTSDVESDPYGPFYVGLDTPATPASITVNTDGQTGLSHFRIYTSMYSGVDGGGGLVEPHLLATVAIDGTQNITYTMCDAVATEPILNQDRAKPPIFIGLVKWGQRLIGWTKDYAALYISNENEYEYFPLFQSYETSTQTSGCIVEVGKGDGNQVTAVVPFGSSLFVFKEGAVYRLTELQMGIYGVQPFLSIGCISPGSAVATPLGLVWRSSEGWYLLTNQEELKYIGNEIAYFHNKIVDRQSVKAVNTPTGYVCSFLTDDDEYITLVYDGGWTGPHTVESSCWFLDIDGRLLHGVTGQKDTRISSGIAIARLNVSGSYMLPPSEISTVHPSHDPQDHSIDFEYVSGLWKFGDSHRNTSIRGLRVGITVFNTDKWHRRIDENLTFEFLDHQGNIMVTKDLHITANGHYIIPISSPYSTPQIQLKIRGTLNKALALSDFYADVETWGKSINVLAT